MVEKIIFDKDLIKKVTNRTDISILFIKLNQIAKTACYRTDICSNYKYIDIRKVIDL